LNLPDVVALRGTGRALPGDVYQSQLARRLDAVYNGAVFDKNNSLYEIGLDWFQCFAFKQYSLGVLCIR
jgi:hypothetical protein